MAPPPTPEGDAADPLAEAFFGRLMDGPMRLASGTGPDAPERIGDWEVHEPIGRGGVSLVYNAVRQTPYGPERAAVKLGKRPGAEVVALFEREATMLRRLPPMLVVRLLDQGLYTDGRPYLAMETAVGQRSTDHARRLSPWERLLLAWRLCRAVAVLHDEGVVHADLKPEHLLVRPDGAVTILDFGLARDLLDASDTPSGLRLGITPEFAAPEQVLGEPVTRATDVFALGLVIHEIMLGRRKRVPWALGKVALDLPATPDDAVGSPWASVDWSLVGVLQTAVQADPDRRYASADALAEALDGVLDATAS
ncbi:MAG: serine/threonine-protein kinase [Bacteroidota bacterium]